MPVVNIDCQIPFDKERALPVTGIDIVTSNSSRVFVYDKINSNNTNIYYTEDDGLNWTAVDTTITLHSYFPINDNGYGFIVGGTNKNQICVTQDNGNTFTVLTYTTNTVNSIDSHAVVSKIGNFGYFSYIDSSGNRHFMKIDGTTVTDQYSAASNIILDSYDLVEQNGTETIYCRFGYTQSIRKSTDGGITWTSIGNFTHGFHSISHTFVNNELRLFIIGGIFNDQLFISNDEFNTYYTNPTNAKGALKANEYYGVFINGSGATALSITTDGGYTLTNTNRSLTYDYLGRTYTYNGNKVYYINSTNLGIFEFPAGSHSRNVLGFQRELQLTIPQDLSRSRQNTGSFYISCNNSRVFDVRAYNSSGTVYYTDDEGVTWNSTTNIGTPYSKLYINDNGYGLIKVNSSGWKVSCTQDNGASFTLITIPNTQSIIALGVSQTSNHGYVSINNTDGSRNFVKITGTTVTTQNSTFTPDYFTIIELAGTEYIFGSYSGTIYKSTDGGVTWSTQNTTIGGDLYSTVIDNTIYLYSRTNGLHISKDEGVTWKQVETQTVAAFDIDGKNGIMYKSIGGEKFYITNDGGYTWEVVVDGNISYGSNGTFAIK